MIANQGRERMMGTSDFHAAVGYIVREGPQHERDHEPPLAVWCDGVASIRTAALEMTATAAQSRAKEPLFHLIVSWGEGERPTYEQAREALDVQMQHLGLADLQYVAALQNDGIGGKFHIHAVINRVDPETHIARDMWQSKERMQAACREVELEQGWRVVESPTRSQGRSRGARDMEYYTHRASFERRVREEIGPALRERLERDGATWASLHAFCREQGVRYEPVIRGERVAGARLTGTERGEFARARELGEDLTHPKLLERLGAFERDRTAELALPFAERCRAAAVDIERLRESASGRAAEAPGWDRVHAAFERHGLEYQAIGTGARIADMDGPETVKPSAVDRGLSMSAMRERYGAFETTAQARERAQAREVVRHAESLVVGARLIEDPSPVLERLTTRGKPNIRVTSRHLRI